MTFARDSLIADACSADRAGFGAAVPHKPRPRAGRATAAGDAAADF